MSSPKPAILLAHGSYHTPQPYARLRALLSKQGYETHCPQLPCASRDYLVADPRNPSFDQPPPSQGLPTQDLDVAALRAVLRRLVEEQGRDVLLLAHSSGGWTATEIATPELQRGKRGLEGRGGGVVGIFYMASFLVMLGESVWSTFAASTGEAEQGAREGQGWFSLLVSICLFSSEDSQCG